MGPSQSGQLASGEYPRQFIAQQPFDGPKFMIAGGPVAREVTFEHVELVVAAIDHRARIMQARFGRRPVTPHARPLRWSPRLIRSTALWIRTRVRHATGMTPAHPQSDPIRS